MSNDLNAEFEALVTESLDQSYAQELGSLFATDAPESLVEVSPALVVSTPAPEYPVAPEAAPAPTEPAKASDEDTWTEGMPVMYRSKSKKIFVGVIEKIAIHKGQSVALLKCTDGKQRAFLISALRHVVVD